MEQKMKLFELGTNKRIRIGDPMSTGPSTMGTLKRFNSTVVVITDDNSGFRIQRSLKTMNLHVR